MSCNQDPALYQPLSYPAHQVADYAQRGQPQQHKSARIRLKGVELRPFSGENKTGYPAWKAAFMSVVDEAEISTKEKMLRLQSSLSGKALTMVKDLGYTTNAYKRAKEKLKKKYGGQRRTQITHGKW